MRTYIIVSIVLAVLAIIFSIQNAQTEMLNLGPWTIEGSLGLMVLTAFVMGLIVGLLTSTALKRAKKQNEKKTAEASSAMPSQSPPKGPGPHL